MYFFVTVTLFVRVLAYLTVWSNEPLNDDAVVRRPVRACVRASACLSTAVAQI